VKIDPYLNYDSGLMNPFVHGEVFVTEDGGETDLDIGRYERFLLTTLSRSSNITTGQVYLEVIRRERRGEYLGKCVQIIPHVTDEIISRIRQASKTDVSVIEIGGTVGDIEGMPFFEAIRQMRLEEGRSNTLIAHVALVPFLEVTKEYKTKPLQHSVQELRRIGLQPDLVFVRSKGLPNDEVMSKVALFSSIQRDSAFCATDLSCVYELPKHLETQGLGTLLCAKLALPCGESNWTPWKEAIDGIVNPRDEVRIALVGKYVALEDSYISVVDALKHAGGKMSVRVLVKFVESEELELAKDPDLMLDGCHGVLVPGGYGIRGSVGKMIAMKRARENGIPFLGICFGFQLSAVEFARDVLRLDDANTTEIDPHTSVPIVRLSTEQNQNLEMGGTQRLGSSRITIKQGTLAHRIYRGLEIYERHRHRYELNRTYVPMLEKSHYVASGFSDDGRIEILELRTHPFYFAAQYHPEFKSWPGAPNPAFYAFISAAFARKSGLEIRPASADFSYPSMASWPS